MNHPAYISNDQYNIYCCFLYLPFRKTRRTKHRRHGRNEGTQRTGPVARFRSLELVSRRTQTDLNASTFSASATVHSSLPSTEVTSSCVPSVQDEPSILDFLKAWLPDLDRRDADGCTALHHAVKRGLRLVVRHFLENDTLVLGLGCSIRINLAHLLNVKDRQGRTPIHHATILNNMSLLYLLAEHMKLAEFNLEAADNQGQTILHIAAGQGQLSTVKYLLQKERWDNKAVLDLLKARDMSGFTALHLAALNGHDEVVKSLLACESELTGAAQGRSTRLRMMEEVDACYSQTPLHYAVRLKHVEIVRALVNGLDNAGRPISTGNRTGNEHINIPDYQGRTALHLACIIPAQIPTHGNSDEDGRRVAADMVTILVEAGAKVNVRDTIGCTPLMYAAQRANVRAVKCLVQRGADVAVRDGGCGGNEFEVGGKSRDAVGQNALDYAEDDAPRGTERDEVMRILDLSLVGRRNTF